MMKILQSKYLVVLSEMLTGLRYGLQTFTVLQALALVPALVLARMYGYAVVIISAFLLVCYLSVKFTKWLGPPTKEGLIRYKTRRSFFFMRSRGFYLVLSLLSTICLFCAVYSTWFYGRISIDKIKEINVYIDTIPWQLIAVMPTYVSTVFGILVDALKALQSKDVEVMSQLANNASSITSSAEFHMQATFILWLLYGLLNQPGRIYNEGMRVSKEVERLNGNINVQN